MSQVLRGPNSRCAIEVLRTDGEAVLAMLDTDCQVTLISHPLAWAEIGEQFREGKHWFEFDQVWHPLMRHGPTGIEPYPLFEAVRKIIRGCFSAPSGFKGGSLDALAEILPHGDVHLFAREWGFIGRFSSLEDAQMIAAALKVVKPVIFSTAEEFMELSDLDQGAVLSDLDPAKEWPAKITMSHAIGVLEMAKAKTKSKTKKVAKAEASQKRADGPVAQARALFESMKDKDSSEIIKACEAKGINRGTATTQLGRWRKENNITVKRGGARKKADSEKSAEPKTDSKSKKEALPPSKTKGEKRHNKNKPSSPSPSPSPSSSPSPANQEASAPAGNSDTASPASPGAPTAPVSTAAPSSGTASGGPTTGAQSVKREPSPGPTPKK